MATGTGRYRRSDGPRYRGLVRLRGAASVSEIADALDVSPSTVRRNLGALEREVFLKRSRGGSITAVTNDVAIAPVLAEAPDVGVVIPGGEVRRGSFALLGPLLGSFLKGPHVDVALLGMRAISGDALSESSLSVVEAKRAMIRSASRVILLAAHSKFRPPAFFEVARAEAVHDLVIDEGTPKAALEAMDAPGLCVHVV